MKTLTDHINEALKIGKDLSEWSSYSCQPKTKDELREIVKNRISKEGLNCDLNDIDVSLIKDMSHIFAGLEFNGDISKWDVRNVENMSCMFNGSKFNGDISNWDVSNVTNMWCMFNKSKFNGDISEWDVSKVEDMWYMFSNSDFNKDISNWKINKDCIVHNMFYECPIREEYKPKL